MTRYMVHQPKHRLARRRLWILATVAWLVLCWVMPGQQVQAHGGAVIASGFTDAYEWLVAVDPYPTTPGQAVITLLVFDLQTFQPVLDLQEAQLHLTPPGAEASAQEVIVPLETDPALYPGDYSAVVPLEQVGDWQARFVAGGDTPLEITAAFRVFSGPGNAAPAGPPGTPNPDATATAFAQTVAEARAGQNPAGASASPLVIQLSQPTMAVENTLAFSTMPSGRANPFGNLWWLWSVLGLIPIAALFVWALRPYQEDES